MIVEKILVKLPKVIHFEGITFEMNIFNNGGELRLCYNIISVDKKSKHYKEYKESGSWHNPFYNLHKTFLVLAEKIKEDKDLDYAIDEIHYWLVSKKLIKDEVKPRSKMQGKELEFISIICRDGKGVIDVSKLANQDMSDLDDTVFNITCLSVSEKTYIASEFNSYVVRLK